MSSLNKIVYSIQEKLRVELSDDDPIDWRLIAEEIHTTRAAFIRNEMNRNRTPDPFIIQNLGCVELEVVDRAECCDITIDFKSISQSTTTGDNGEFSVTFTDITFTSGTHEITITYGANTYIKEIYIE